MTTPPGSPVLSTTSVVQAAIPTTSVVQAAIPAAPAAIAPKIGGLLATGVGPTQALVLVPWVGGVPMPAWDATRNTEPESPFCMHPVGTGEQLRIHAVSVKGLKEKFGAGDATYPLASFETAVWEHLVDKGLDSVFYILEPHTNDMVEIVTRHSRFPMSYIRTYIKTMQDPSSPCTYDTYDNKNLVSARKFILASLTDELHHAVERQIDETTTRPEVWMLVIEQVQSDTS